jgi:heme-degrading monooxygenase HmoA
MYTVDNHLYLNVPIESIRQSAEQGLVPMLKDIPGFHGFNLVKAAEDHLIMILFWESLKNANHGASVK